MNDASHLKSAYQEEVAARLASPDESRQHADTPYLEQIEAQASRDIFAADLAFLQKIKPSTQDSPS